MTKATQVANQTRRAAARRVLCVLTAADDKSDDLAQTLTTPDTTWLRTHGQATLAWVRYRDLTGVSTAVMTELKRAYYTAVADTELHRRELVKVLDALTNLGIAPVLFKGAALAHTVYPDPACRTMGDLDLWITADEMPRAQAVLEAIGYRFEAKPDRPPALMALYSGEVRLYGLDKSAGLVELHFGVFAGEWLRRTACVDEAQIRSHATATQIVGRSVYVLAAEDAILQLAAHTAINHQLSLSALRSLVDITLLAHHQPLDWSVVIQRARTWRVATATWLVLSLAVDLCGLDEATAAVRQLAPSRLRQKLIGLFANADTLVNMRDLSRSQWRYLYLLLLVDRKRDALKLVFRTLWPEDDWLRARYGQGGWRVRVQHLFGAARGRI